MGKMSNLPDHMPSEEDCVLLLPFSHQIGGHNIVLQYNDSTICKLLNLREQYFYESIPHDLKEYLPEYRGTIEVKIQENEEGMKKFLAYNIRNRNSRRRHVGESTLTTPSTTTSSSSVATSTTDSSSTTTTCCCESTNSTDKIQITTKTTPNYVNPTIAQLQKTFLNKINPSNDTVLSFLLLENMVAKYKYPCILDIKMGTQQHGDDASEQKKQLQTLKCQMSTSSKIGSRLCGMQVYQVNTRKYIGFDKYEGRQLSVDGFKRNLLQYLNNGYKFRIDVIDKITDKLEHLYQIVKSKSTYRFYGSSLLILYDGRDDMNEKNEPINSTVDVRMIDFAHSTHSGYKDGKQHNGPDKGYLFGLENLIKIFEEIKCDCIKLSGDGCGGESCESCDDDKNRTSSCSSTSSTCSTSTSTTTTTITMMSGVQFLANNTNVSHIRLNEPLQQPPDPTPSPSVGVNENVFFLQQQQQQ